MKVVHGVGAGPAGAAGCVQQLHELGAREEGVTLGHQNTRANVVLQRSRSVNDLLWGTTARHCALVQENGVQQACEARG